MKTMTAMLVMGLVLGGGVVAVAGHAGPAMHGQQDGGGPMAVPHMVAWVVDAALDDVNATDAQRAKVTAVKDRILAQAEALHTAHDATHEEFKRQWTSDRMDAGRLHALVDARLDELRTVLHGSVDGLVEVHDILTPEQRAKLTAKAEAMHGAK